MVGRISRYLGSTGGFPSPLAWIYLRLPWSPPPVVIHDSATGHMESLLPPQPHGEVVAAMEDPKMRAAPPRVEGSCGARVNTAVGGGAMRHWMGQRHCRWVSPSSPHGVAVASVINIVVAAARVEARALHAATAVAGTPEPLFPSNLLVSILTLNRELAEREVRLLLGTWAC